MSCHGPSSMELDRHVKECRFDRSHCTTHSISKETEPIKLSGITNSVDLALKQLSLKTATVAQSEENVVVNTNLFSTHTHAWATHQHRDIYMHKLPARTQTVCKTHTDHDTCRRPLNIPQRVTQTDCPDHFQLWPWWQDTTSRAQASWKTISSPKTSPPPPPPPKKKPRSFNTQWKT